MRETMTTIWLSLRNIQFADKFSIIATDPRIRNNCQSPQYLKFKNKLIEAGRYAIETDCKIYMEYSPNLFMTKFDYCVQHYTDEVKMTTKVLSMENFAFWTVLNDCTFQKFGLDFTKEHVIGRKY